jgi:hypothetical protein
MSNGTRITIAVATLIGGTCFALLEFPGLIYGDTVVRNPLAACGMSASCFVVATACLWRRSQPITLLITVVAVLVPILAGMGRPFPVFLEVLVAIVGPIILLYGAQYLSMRWQYRILFKANRLADKGDTQGATDLLREHYRQEGPSIITCNGLATFFINQEKWEEALRMAEEAEQIGGPRPEFLFTQGIALWKLGRFQAAMRCLEDVAHQWPEDLLATWRPSSHRHPPGPEVLVSGTIRPSASERGPRLAASLRRALGPQRSPEARG